MSQTEDADPNREEATAETADTVYGLTEQGAWDAVTEVAELEGERNGRQNSKFSIRDMYHHLIKVESCTKAEMLDRHFRPVDVSPDPDIGRYGEFADRQWFEEIGRPTLADLPGVEPPADDGDDDRWQFAGISDPDPFGEEAVPLAELRADPKLRAARELGGFGTSDSSRSALVGMYSTILSRGEVTSETLASKVPEDARGVNRSQPGTVEHQKRKAFDRSFADDLEQLPDVEREEWAPRSPEEIEINTMRDVIDAREELDSEPREIWRRSQ